MVVDLAGTSRKAPPSRAPKPTFEEGGARTLRSAALELERVDLTSEIFTRLTSEIHSLNTDDLLLGVLEASISENVATFLHVLEHGIPMDEVDAPTAALEYARRLAQHGIPVTDLIRAYRLGQASFLERLLPLLIGPASDPSVITSVSLEAFTLAAAYIDQVTEAVILAYEEERDRWQHHRSAMRSMHVRMLLSGASVNVDAAQTALAYRLHRHHVGIVAWARDLRGRGEVLADLLKATRSVARTFGSDEEPLFVPHDDHSAYAWISLDLSHGDNAGDAERNPRLESKVSSASFVLPGDPGREVCLALGEPGYGTDGFVRTHRQARAAQTVALAAGDAGSVNYFRDVGPLAVMCSDMASTRAWVSETLGELAHDDEQYARLRTTLATFLRTGGSYSETSALLHVHKNTVQYRVRRADEVRGRHWREDRLNVELALLACERLGTAVLSPAST